MKYSFVFFAIIIVILCRCSANRESQEDSNSLPNIILIVADDMGYGDVGAFGQEVIQTPNLDSIAGLGIKFTHFYAGSTVCAPSRCALMTGLHMGNAYVRGNDPVKGARMGDGLPLREQDLTVAEHLKKAGYKTAMFGKWGLGVEGTPGEPQMQGWDEFFGYLNQADAHKYYFDHLWQSNKDSVWKVPVDTNSYTHDLIMDKAFAYLDRQRSDTPFFLYLPMAPPHAELLLPEKYMAPYLDSAGNSVFEEELWEGNFLYRPQNKPKAAYAGMVTKIDTDFGKIMQKLEAMGIAENTLVIFTSDNGPHAEGGYDPEYFNSNGILRGHKRDLYEGGIRVPTIAYWKGKTPEVTADTPYAFWDILPTFSELAGLTPPDNIDGISFAGLLKGQQADKKHDYLYWEFHRGGDRKFSQALLRYPWKLIRTRDNPSAEIVVELYHLENDPSESVNLIDQEQSVLNEMLPLLDAASSEPAHPAFAYSKEVFSGSSARSE